MVGGAGRAHQRDARTPGPRRPEYLAEVHDVIANNRLDETFVDVLREPAEVFTYGGMIAHVPTFAAHNRTLAVPALKQAGVGDLGWGDSIPAAHVRRDGSPQAPTLVR
jgi:hypothetical protein